jgi:hypothetical protein
MKKRSKEEQAKTRQRLQAHREAQLRAKTELVNEARTAEEKEWAEELWPDGSTDAWFHRKYSDETFIKKHGGFSDHVVMLALTDPDWETKETVAAWLRKELKQLREAEATPGAAPVRQGKAMSRIEIAEIAVELLACLAGQKLTCLFQELLDVDRHRKLLSETFSQLESATDLEAQAQLQGKELGVRLFAKAMSVSPSSVTRWRRSAFYWERVEGKKKIWELVLREDYFEKIKATAPDATDTECFRRAFQMYWESLPTRRSQYSQGSAANEVTACSAGPESRQSKGIGRRPRTK